VQFGFTASGQLEQTVSACRLNGGDVDVTYVGAAAAPASSGSAPPTAPPQVVVPPTPAAPPTTSSALTTAVNIDSQWSGGYTGTIKITNTGSSATEHWFITWTNGPMIASLWNGG